MDLHLSHATLAVRVENTGKFGHGDPYQRQFHARASTARVRVWQSLNIAGKTGWQGPPASVFDFRVDAKPQNQYIGVLEYEQTGMNTRSFPGSEAVRADGSMTSSPSPLSLRNCGSESKPISSLRVAYQGVPGAYSEAAASKAYPNCEAVPCDQFEAAFEAVELCQVDRAVLPAENSLGGSIHRNYDLLLRHRLHIVGEVQLAVHHCLLGVSGTKKEDLRRVLSHPQALAQCEHTLVGLGVTRESMGDTAGAAQFVATLNHKDTGAVASYRAAEIYGLDILADGIQDDLENVTRFLMLAREPIIRTNVSSFKTSIVFSLEEGPGVLFKALAVFALRNINLTKIESRPLRKKPLRVGGNTKNGGAKYFNYLFYVDFEASLADAQAQNALHHLSEFATFVRVLGSYPMDLTILQSTNERGGRS